jgi:hypothetical protein
MMIQQMQRKRNTADQNKTISCNVFVYSRKPTPFMQEKGAQAEDE